MLILDIRYFGKLKKNILTEFRSETKIESTFDVILRNYTNNKYDCEIDCRSVTFDIARLSFGANFNMCGIKCYHT